MSIFKNKKITLYKGNIYRVFADNVKLNEKGRLVPKIKSEIVDEDELFYAYYRVFVSIKHDTVLPDRDEATDLIDNILNNSKYKGQVIDLMKAAQDEKQKEAFSQYLKCLSSCLYFSESELVRDKSITNGELQKFIKSYKKKK